MLTTKDKSPFPDAFLDYSPEHFVNIASWPLPDDPSTAGLGRKLIRSALTTLGFDEEVVHDGATIVSELLTNAISHARAPYELRLYSNEREVVCEVVDGLETLPPSPDGELTHLTFAELDEADDFPQIESGRGLGIVYHLSGGRCGSRLTEVRSGRSLIYGKSVWFALSLRQGDRSEA
jgi:anti-sigma regulatory factor (Ser/Thr protein kinase)